MVNHLEDYVWSSYPAYIGKIKPPPGLYQQEVYEQLTSNRQRKRKYQAFADDSHMPDSFLKFYNRQRLDLILGGKVFIERVKSLLSDTTDEVSHGGLQFNRPAIERIVAIVSDYYGVPDSDIYAMGKGRGKTNQPRKKPCIWPNIWVDTGLSRFPVLSD